MKLYKIKSLLEKYKYFFLFILALIILFILFFPSVKEGLTNNKIGYYEYLKPPPANQKWSDATWKALYQKLGRPYPPDDFTMKGFYSVMTEEEVNYFVKNDNYPIDDYVKNYLNNNTDNAIPENILKSINAYKKQNETNADYLSKRVSNRELYANYIEPKEKLKSPQPLSYQIYLGTAQPPPDAPSPSSSIFPSITSQNTSSSLSGPDYSKLVSICKSIIK